MFDKVILVSASAGAGHVRAMEAMEKTLRAAGAARNVESLDILVDTNPFMRWFYSKGYAGLVNRFPNWWAWVYDHTDRPGRGYRWRMFLERLFFGRFIKRLEREKPDLVVSTHFMPPEIVSYMRRRRKFASPQAVVVTDLDVHETWLSRDCEHYFVSLDESKEYLAAKGVPRDRITVSGIPTDPVFLEKKDRAAMAAKHGLDPAVTTILISAGGFGLGPVESIMRSLLHLKHPAQIITVCGRSEALKARMEALAAGVEPGGSVRVKVVGFTREMDELMSCSDMLVGKPGGLTMSEALIKGLVFVIVNPIPGQESRNTDHLLEEGAAIRSNNLPALAWKIDRLLDAPARLASMRENVRRLAKPDAAKDIVEKLMTLKASSSSPSPSGRGTG